jgi:hypothetical protein
MAGHDCAKAATAVRTGTQRRGLPDTRRHAPTGIDAENRVLQWVGADADPRALSSFGVVVPASVW